ncbi:MAG: hypothetical protein Q7J20_08175, partial [Candidatus Nitrotoga sp.]|nr:hypothetical protein [Candidatus Nitrotoga sp.]
RRNSCQTQANSPVTTAKFTHGLWRNQLFSVSLAFSPLALRHNAISNKRRATILRVQPGMAISPRFKLK